ncbi:hypothetical protein D0B54_14805 [Solimonas sp. K1W22B-7]|uniref:hypothetical protein n=1 Tax=Solimonas sp. K1W22B-7 TaxID=2303331 RepID=UPI000E333B17|nr:hypothetical protein [Solimonas sp. K1W22B-7]AXQ29868.1 hypothetical protein D0B54_14805 [Solimonas sp. K1W22B-7]
MLLRAAAGLLLTLLAACGRGPAGSLEVEGGELSFVAEQGQAPPPPQTLSLRVDEAGAQRIGSGLKEGEAADWLSTRIDGNPPELKLLVAIVSTSLAPGDYTARLEVATGDAQENILQSREVLVRYRVTGKP